MPRFKIQPSLFGTLCARCENGQVYERKNGNIETRCHAGGDCIAIQSDVARCTDFEDKNDISKWDMERIAWILRHDRGGRIKGFEPPAKKES